MPAGSTLAGTYGYGRSATTSTSIIPFVSPMDPRRNASQCVIKYSTDGNILWRAIISGAGGATISGSPPAATGFTSTTASDSAGNIYVVGYFSDLSADFYNSDNTLFGSLVNLGGNDAFLVKYNSRGFVQWTARILSSTSTDTVNRVTVDSLGNVFIGGYFTGTSVFIGSDNVPYRQVTAVSTFDAFVAKLDGLGNFQWISRLSGTTGTDYLSALVTDGAGSLYVCVYYLNGSLTTFNGVSRTGTETAFGTALASIGASFALIKYDTNGVIQWRSRFGGSANANSNVMNMVISPSGTTLYMAFTISGASILFYNAADALILTQPTVSGTYDPMLVAYDTSGTPLWTARNTSTNASDYAINVAIDPSSNVYALYNMLTAYTISNADTSSFATSIPTSVPIIKYNASGAVQWYGRFANCIPTGLACDTAGNVYISMYLSAQFTYTNPTGITTTGPPWNGTSDVIFLKLDTSGNFVWYTRIVSILQSELSLSVAPDGLGNMIVTSTVGATAYDKSVQLFNANGSLFTQLPPAFSTSTDVFLARYTSAGSGIWARRIGSFNGATTSRYCGMSSTGDVYVTGQYNGVPLIATSTSNNVQITNTVAAAPDSFLAKYNANGVFQWGVRLSSTNGFSELISRPKVDSAGNVYIPIVFTSPLIIFGSDGTSYTLTPSGSVFQTIMVKYNASGIIQWYVTLYASGGAGYSGFTSDVVIDSSDNIIITFPYVGNVTVTQSDNSTYPTLINSVGQADIALVKFTSAGLVSWVNRMGSSGGGDYPTQVDVDSSGNVYLTLFGTLTQTFTFYNASTVNGSSVASIAIVSAPDSVVVKFNSSGTYQWAYRIGVSTGGSENPTGIAVDNAGNSYHLATYTTATQTFPTPSFSIPAPTGTDIVLLKYDTNGTPVWFSRITGSGTEAAGNIVCNKATGTVYFVGQMGTGGITYINPAGSIAGALYPETANNDGFVASVDTNGNLLWALRTGGIYAENITGIDYNQTSDSISFTGTYFLTGAWACSVGY